MASLKKLFELPKFRDEIESQQAHLLHSIAWILVCVPIPFVFYAILLKPEIIARVLTQAACGEAINFVVLVMLHRKYVNAASILQVSAFWIFTTVTAFTGGGVKSDAYLLGYWLVITLAGILIGRNGSFIIAFLSLATGALMIYAQPEEILSGGATDTRLTTWVVSLVLFPAGAALQYLASRTLRKALDRARASEEKYRLISQVSSDYTFATEIHKDGSATLSWVAGAFEQMTGYTFEEYVAGGSWIAHVHPADLEKDAADMQKLYQNQDVKSEIRTFAKNGEVRWEQIFAHPIWDEQQNRLIGIFGAVRDITEQKRAQAALAYERDILQIFMDNIPDLIYFKDAESRFIRINQAEAEFLGAANPRDAIGKTDLDFQNPELARELMAEEKKIVETGELVLNRIELNPTKDGNLRWLATTKVPAMNELGQIIGTIGISRNITEQKKAEELEKSRRTMLEKVVQLGKEVTESGDLRSTIIKIWRGIHEDLGFDRVAIFLFNPEGNTMDDTFGTNRNGEMVDQWHLSFPIDATFAALLKNPNGLYFTSNYDGENHIAIDHEMYGVKDYAAIAAWAGDQPVAVLCADTSITQRLISTEQLEALRLFGGYAGLAIQNARLNSTLQSELETRKNFIVELESKNAELERFTYTVSHDLKSPLVTIRGFLGYLERDAQDGDFAKFRHDADRIDAAVEKMQDLLRDLLELSRIGRLINTPVAINFNDIVKDALDLVQGQANASNVVVEYHETEMMIKGDRVRLTEALQNLIDNAIKFMGDQPHPRVEIGICPKDQNENVFYVKDNGIGIAPQFHGKIFGLFDKLSSDTDGTGIGLALVKRIIEIHGGRIWVESQLREGTTFYFTLP